MVHYARALHFSQTHQRFFFLWLKDKDNQVENKNNNKYSTFHQIWSWRTKQVVILQKVGTFLKLYSLKNVLMTLIHRGFLKDFSTQSRKLCGWSDSCRVLNLCLLSCRLAPLYILLIFMMHLWDRTMQEVRHQLNMRILALHLIQIEKKKVNKRSWLKNKPVEMEFKLRSLVSNHTIYWAVHTIFCCVNNNLMLLPPLFLTDIHTVARNSCQVNVNTDCFRYLKK